jgi:glycosyltransferase involved in cell wall biosynthesis
MIDVSFIILTKDEEIHIERSIRSVEGIASDIFVVDSGSTDATCEIAESMGAKVFSNPWPGNHSAQFNWALDHLSLSTKWVFKLDADEYLTEELCQELEARLPDLPEDCTGIVFPLRRVFMGRHIRHSTGTVRLLRMFRFGKGRCEARRMDEHIQLSEGRSVDFDGEFADDNLRDIGWWTRKHDGYAIREAIDLLDIEFGIFEGKVEGTISAEAAAKRRLKERYARQPLFLRAFLYFIYRYLFKLGFLDGVEGFLWNFLQGWWYRTLVDAKIYEIKKACGNDRGKIKDYLSAMHSISI